MTSFGETLRRERELRGIDLREVAEATKISVRFLQALENGRLDILPGGIFPRAFVRQYAAYLGLDPERTVAEFIYSSGGPEGEPVAPTPRVAPVTRARPVPVGAALGALGALVLALLAWRQIRSDETAAAPSPPPPVSAPATFPGDRVFPPPTASPAAALTPTEGLVLDLLARQQCWVAVQSDGVRVIDRVLAQGERQRLSARRELVLSVGNAGGVSFSVNGRTGVPLGRDGEVRRNVVITHQSLPSLVEGAVTAPAAFPPATAAAGPTAPPRRVAAPAVPAPATAAPSPAAETATPRPAPTPPLDAASPAPTPTGPPATTTASPGAPSTAPPPSTPPSPRSE